MVALRVMVGRFDEVCKRKGLKINAGQSKVVVLNREEELECDVHVNVIRLEHVSGFKYLGCVLDEAVCSRKVSSGRRVAGANRSLVNARDLQLECARVLHETLLVLVLMYSSETMLCKEKERSRIRVVQMENLRGLLGIMGMDRVPNARLGELCGVKKGLDERIDEGVLCWLGHVERIERDKIAKRLCRSVCW